MKNGNYGYVPDHTGKDGFEGAYCGIIEDGNPVYATSGNEIKWDFRKLSKLYHETGRTAFDLSEEEQKQYLRQ